MIRRSSTVNVFWRGIPFRHHPEPQILRAVHQLGSACAYTGEQGNFIPLDQRHVRAVQHNLYVIQLLALFRLFTTFGEKFAQRLCSLDRARKASMDSRHIHDLLEFLFGDADIECITSMDLHE